MTQPPLHTSELFLQERAPGTVHFSRLADLLRISSERSEVFSNRSLGAESVSGLACYIGERQGVTTYRCTVWLHALSQLS